MKNDRSRRAGCFPIDEKSQSGRESRRFINLPSPFTSGEREGHQFSEQAVRNGVPTPRRLPGVPVRSFAACGILGHAIITNTPVQGVERSGCVLEVHD